MKSVLFALLLMAAGCTSSKITSSWTAPEAGRHPYKKIVVISLLSPTDSTSRDQRLKMETCLTADLRAFGNDAISFLQTFDEKQFRGLRYDSIRQRFQRSGIDAVITISLMSKQRDSVYIPCKPANELVSCRSRHLLPETTPKNDEKAGYFVSSTQVYWESHFYDLEAMRLMYRVQSTSFEPVPIEKLASQYGRLVAEDLLKNSVLVARSQ